jgi:hypothetical protein
MQIQQPLLLEMMLYFTIFHEVCQCSKRIGIRFLKFLKWRALAGAFKEESQPGVGSAFGVDLSR